MEMYFKMGELQAKEDYTKRNEKCTDAGTRAGLFQFETIKECEAKCSIFSACQNNISSGWSVAAQDVIPRPSVRYFDDRRGQRASQVDLPVRGRGFV
jgi:hypothetical protein